MDIYVKCITEQNVSFFNCKKKLREIACLILSFGAGTKCFALFFGDSVTLLLWFNLLEFLGIYFTATTTKKIQGKFDFKIIKWIIIKQEPLSNKVEYSENTENQMYLTLSTRLVITYPSAVTMTLSLCYHHMILFQTI